MSNSDTEDALRGEYNVSENSIKFILRIADNLLSGQSNGTTKKMCFLLCGEKKEIAYMDDVHIKPKIINMYKSLDRLHVVVMASRVNGQLDSVMSAFKRFKKDEDFNGF